MVFGKPLASQAVIRSKVAAMISRSESCQSWIENLTHQMNNMVSFPISFALWRRESMNVSG